MGDACLCHGNSKLCKYHDDCLKVIGVSNCPWFCAWCCNDGCKIGCEEKRRLEYQLELRTGVTGHAYQMKVRA